jgi:hypothetical protein
MLEQTVYLKTKQDSELFIDTPLHVWLMEFIDSEGLSSVNQLITASGCTEDQVRCVVADLYRRGSLQRHEFKSGKLRYYVYRKLDWLWAGFEKWTMPADYLSVYNVLKFSNYGRSSIEVYRVLHARLPMGTVNRIVAELWRAQMLKRKKTQEGNSWWYEYKDVKW